MDLPIDLHTAHPSAFARDAEIPAAEVSSSTGEDLIRSAQAGNPEAFRTLVEWHQGLILRFCLHWLHDSEDAREAVQDTFIRAWQALDRYEHRGLFTHWLYRIALNVCRDRQKSKASRQRRATSPLGQGESPFACQRPTPDETLARSGELEKLQRGMDLLPERLRVVLILCGREGLSQEEAGAILNCSARAVEGRLYRARKELLAWWNRIG